MNLLYVVTTEIEVAESVLRIYIVEKFIFSFMKYVVVKILSVFDVNVVFMSVVFLLESVNSITASGMFSTLMLNDFD